MWKVYFVLYHLYLNIIEDLVCPIHGNSFLWWHWNLSGRQGAMPHCIHCIEIVSRTWKWLHYVARASKLPRFQYYRALMGNVGPTSSLYRTSTIFKETALNILEKSFRVLIEFMSDQTRTGFIWYMEDQNIIRLVVIIFWLINIYNSIHYTFSLIFILTKQNFDNPN